MCILFYLQYLSLDLSTLKSSTSENFEAVNRALERVGVSNEKIMRIYRILAAILHLGNIAIKDDNSSSKCEILQVTRFHFEITADLLNIEQQTLETALLTRDIEVNGDQIM